MPLSDSDRKLLWGRAGNRCSYRFEDAVCAEALSLVDSGKDIVVGEECHIVGEKPGSPRYREGFPEPDAYPNRMLLCRKHHTIVDDNESVYTEGVLREMKARHETAVAQAVGGGKDSTEPIVIKNSVFRTTATDTKRAVGMEVNCPAVLSGVESHLTARNVEEAIGFSTNQRLTCARLTCPRCKKAIPLVCTGPMPSSVTCPHCGHTRPLGTQPK